MDKEIKIARIGAISVIIAAIIGGLFTIIPTIIENDKLKKDYEELQAKNSELIAQQNILKDTYKNSQTKYDNLNDNYISLQDKFEALEKEYDILLHKNDPGIDNESITEQDQLEIDEILETLSLYQNNDNTKHYFRNLLIDSSEVELFYKIHISIHYYKYSNILIAFNKYGIKCEDLSITEGILELWDIENLYIYNQIYENIDNSEEKVYLFKDYKMDPIDKCDYKEYGFGYYQNETYDEISKDISERIKSFIRKMRRNSLPIE